MARNSRRSNGMKKLQPAPMTLLMQNVDVPAANGGVGSVDAVIDISQCASLVNRRFYRQGLNWVVGGIKILATPAGGGVLNGSVKVEKLPYTWVMSNSWEKGFRAWDKMNKEALEETESVKPRFLDFKIYADESHHTAGFGANLLPISGAGAMTTAGEWSPSSFRIPDTSSGANATQHREIIATGQSYPGVGASGFNAVSLIEGYAASRSLPNVLDPNTPADAASVDGGFPDNWLAATFNEGTQQTEDVIEDMTTENNIAPYPFENDGVNVDTMYPGGANQLTGLQIHDFELITGTTIGGTTRLKGGMFPCGLMLLRLINESESVLQLNILVDLVPGPHRGYLATPMTEM